MHPSTSTRRRRIGPRPAWLASGVVFLNFDGAVLVDGDDDARTNASRIWSGAFEPYGDGSKRAAVLQAVAEDWAAYDVRVTDTRPAAGSYAMAMIGPTNFLGDDVLGVAPLDCGDAERDNVAFAFHSAGDAFAAATQATTISQELAHSFGLEHVAEPGDIMNPYPAGGNPVFLADCIELVQPVVCGPQHAAECGSASAQSSHRELLARLGPAGMDTEGPSVAIVSLSDGDVYEAGVDFDVIVSAIDDVAVDSIALVEEGVQIAIDEAPPWGWSFSRAPVGTYELYVEAVDYSGNRGHSDVLVVEIVGDEAGEDALPPTYGDSARAADVSGCTVSAAEPGRLAPLVLLLAARVRRRCARA